MSRLDKFLPPHLVSNPAWKEFAELAAEMIEEHITPKIGEIRNFMDPNKVHTEMLSILAASLGFDLKSELFDEPTFRRLINALSKYYQQSGTRVTSKFLSYSISAVFEFREMWTEDYQKFLPEPQGRTIYEGGTWWRTPHIELRYDTSTGIIDAQSLTELFYVLAPIHLVLDGVIEAILLTEAGKFYVVGAEIEHIYLYTDKAGLPTQQYYNDTQTAPFRRNNCADGSDGSVLYFTIAAGTYVSSISRDNANQLAREALVTLGQEYVNANGVCDIACAYVTEDGLNANPATAKLSDFLVLESTDLANINFSDRLGPENCA